MKTKSIFNNKFQLMFLFLLISSVALAQGGAHPGGEQGLPTPIDGGILMALLGAGGLLTMFLKKKKDDKGK